MFGSLNCLEVTVYLAYKFRFLVLLVYLMGLLIVALSMRYSQIILDRCFRNVSVMARKLEHCQHYFSNLLSYKMTKLDIWFMDRFEQIED